MIAMMSYLTLTYDQMNGGWEDEKGVSGVKMKNHDCLNECIV